jgi:hypothetical protein
MRAYDIEDAIPEYQLEFLLAFDGRIHHLEEGYWIKFEVKRVEVADERSHGLSYSFTLHAPDGRRLVGFDNAHGVPAIGSRFKRRPRANDHWHRTENDPGRPYPFKDVETLIDISSTRSNGCWTNMELQRRLSRSKRPGGRNDEL